MLVIQLKWENVIQINFSDQFLHIWESLSIYGDKRLMLTEQHIVLSHVVFCMQRYRRFVVEQMAREIQSRRLLVFGERCAMVL